MRRKTFWIAASCILLVAGLGPVFSSGASPASKEKVIYSFTNSPDGANPVSDLTVDSAGNLYGTTSYGGTGCQGYGGCGTVFELKRTKDGWKEEVLYSFEGGSDGGIPQAGVIFDNSGNLYGTTPQTVFELKRKLDGGWKKTTIYSFPTDGTAGGYTKADPVFDSEGNLYGTAQLGGDLNACNDEGCGVVFELTRHHDDSWAETTVHVFAGAPTDGGGPVAGMVFDSAGNLYGTTQNGGAGSCQVGNQHNGYIYGCGTVYRLTHGSNGSWNEAVLYSLARGTGFGTLPTGEVFFQDASHLLALAPAGGDGFGAAVELNDPEKRGWHESSAHIFYGNPDGKVPVGRLVADANGNLFGVTSKGGGGKTEQLGIVFELRPSNNGWVEKILYSFMGEPDGANPSAGLIFDPQGHLYGTTQHGGTGCNDEGGCGTVYDVTP